MKTFTRYLDGILNDGLLKSPWLWIVEIFKLFEFYP